MMLTAEYYLCSVFPNNTLIRCFVIFKYKNLSSLVFMYNLATSLTGYLLCNSICLCELCLFLFFSFPKTVSWATVENL